MNRMKEFFLQNKWIILSFLVLVIARFIWIDRFPPGMQYDEVEYSLSSKSFQLMGEDISGVGFPASLITTNTLGKVSPVPYMIWAPLWNFIPLTLEVFRSLYVLVNIVTSIIFGFLVYELFKKKSFAVVGTFIFLINPWSIFLSRHAIDDAIVLPFYLLGMIFLLKAYSMRTILLSGLFFLLGAFSYHGAKIQLVPLIISIVTYHLLTNKKSRKHTRKYLGFISFFVVVILGFVVGGSLFSNSIISNRSNEIVFTNTDSFSSQVNSLRQTSISTSIESVFINKWIFAFRYFFSNYFDAFSFSDLFISAEVIEYFGFFYLLDALFIGIGGIILMRKKPSLGLLLLTILLIAPLSTALSMSGLSVLNRAIIMLPILLIFATYGLVQSYHLLSRYIPRIIARFLITIPYITFFVAFMHLYFFVLPIQNNAHYRTTTRVLAQYLSFEKEVNDDITIISRTPSVLYSGLVFYLPRNKQEHALKNQKVDAQKETYTIDGVTLTNKCLAELDPEKTYIIFRENSECLPPFKATQSIIDQKDAGVDYFIVNGKTCSDLTLPRWVYPHKVSDFAIESKNKNDFCARWISSN